MRVYLTIAEDEGLRESLRAMLSDSDILLFETCTQEAMRRLLTVDANAVIVDDTPHLGLEALKSLRESSPDTPVLVLANHSDAETLGGFILAGAKACLAKPFSPDDLLKKLRDISINVSFSEHVEPASVEPAASAVSSDTVRQQQAALRWQGRMMGNLKSSHDVTSTLVDAALDIFDPVGLAVLLEDDGRLCVANSFGLPPSVAESVRLNVDSGIVRYFEQNRHLLDRKRGMTSETASREMQLLGARLGAPILRAGRVVGAILLGDKATGFPYSAEERDLLMTVARGTATALENTSLYQQVSDHQNRLSSIISTISTGVVVVGGDKTVTLLNESAERILQVRPIDVLNRSVQRLGSGFADVALRSMADKRQLLRQEVHDPAIDATLGLSATPLEDGGVVVIFSKLPAKTGMGRENIAYSPFWEYLASRVAQEIKNPLVAISAFAQMLPRKYESEEFRTEYAVVVSREVQRINSVAETLFEFARHPRLTLKCVNLNETVESVLHVFIEELEARSIRLETNLDAALVGSEIDSEMFTRAVENVIQNSIEAMPSGGTLRISTKQDQNECKVIIEDTGPGVPEQVQPLIFLPFFSTKERGMGLGLTMANRIMQQHSGGIKLDPSPEAGGRFTLELPICEKTNADHTGG